MSMCGIVTCSLQQSSCSGLELATVASLQKHAEEMAFQRQVVRECEVAREGGYFRQGTKAVKHILQ